MATSVGIVKQISGSVSIRDVYGNKRALKVDDEVMLGEVIVTFGMRSKAILSLKSGKEVVVLGDDVLVVNQEFITSQDVSNVFNDDVSSLQEEFSLEKKSLDKPKDTAVKKEPAPSFKSTKLSRDSFTKRVSLSNAFKNKSDQDGSCECDFNAKNSFDESFNLASEALKEHTEQVMITLETSTTDTAHTNTDKARDEEISDNTKFKASSENIKSNDTTKAKNNNAEALSLGFSDNASLNLTPLNTFDDTQDNQAKKDFGEYKGNMLIVKAKIDKGASVVPIAATDSSNAAAKNIAANKITYKTDENLDAISSDRLSTSEKYTATITAKDLKLAASSVKDIKIAIPIGIKEGNKISVTITRPDGLLEVIVKKIDQTAIDDKAVSMQALGGVSKVEACVIDRLGNRRRIGSDDIEIKG